LLNFDDAHTFSVSVFHRSFTVTAWPREWSQWTGVA
jgi:hypothetical protein